MCGDLIHTISPCLAPTGKSGHNLRTAYRFRPVAAGPPTPCSIDYYSIITPSEFVTAYYYRGGSAPKRHDCIEQAQDQHIPINIVKSTILGMLF